MNLIKSPQKLSTASVNWKEISSTPTTTTITTANAAVTVCDKNLPYSMLWHVLLGVVCS